MNTHVPTTMVRGAAHLRFSPFKQEEHPAIVDVNQVMSGQLTPGQKIADKVAATVGSWPFIIIQSAILVMWIILNIVGFVNHWDPYPFILLNLALSFQAAYAAPFVMMSQNRQSEKDRLTAQNDYQTDVKGEQEVRHVMEHLDHQDQVILQLIQQLEEQHVEILEHLRRLDPEIANTLQTGIQQVTVQQAEKK